MRSEAISPFFPIELEKKPRASSDGGSVLIMGAPRMAGVARSEVQFRAAIGIVRVSRLPDGLTKTGAQNAN
jgi:hypothetical protein